MAEDKNDKKQPLPSSFTVDTLSDVAQEVPSITKLLNRKAFGGASKPGSKSGQSEKSTITSLTDIWAVEGAPKNPIERPMPPDAAGPQRAADRAGFDESTSNVVVERTFTNLFKSPLGKKDATRTDVDAEQARSTAQSAAPSALPDVKRASPEVVARGRTRNSPLILWERSQLVSSRDPLGQALGDLLGRGVEAALFLTIQAPLPGAPVPHFLGSAAVAASKRRTLWTGLRWDPTLSPELWNQFVKTGRVELQPPGTTTQPGSTRNIVRAAFGVDADHWLTLVRVGPAHACRGVLALVSRKSAQQALDQVQTLLNSLPDLKAA